MLGPLIAFAIGVGVSLLAGGSLERLGQTRFHRRYLFWLGLVVSATVAFGPSGGGFRAYGVALVVLSNAFLIAFSVANRRVPGLVLVAAGIFLNALVIAVNGAMPVSSTAAREVASMQVVGSIKHEPLTNETSLPWLADRIPVAATSQVWSIGDLLLLAGVGMMGFGLPRRGAPDLSVRRRRDPSRAAASP